MNSFKKYFLFIIFLVSFSRTSFSVTFEEIDETNTNIDDLYETCMNAFNKLTLEPERCIICLKKLDFDAITKKGKVITLPCKKNHKDKGIDHSFHLDCLKKWCLKKELDATEVTSFVFACPLCKTNSLEGTLFNQTDQIALLKKKIEYILQEMGYDEDIYEIILEFLRLKKSTITEVLEYIEKNFETVKKELLENCWDNEKIVKLVQEAKKGALFSLFIDTCLKDYHKILWPAIGLKIAGDLIANNYTVSYSPTVLTNRIQGLRFLIQVLCSPELRYRAHIPLLFVFLVHYEFLLEYFA